MTFFLCIFPFFHKYVIWKSSVLFVFCFRFCQDWVSLCSPGCPGIHSIDQAGLEFFNLPPSASQVLGLQACTTTAWLKIVIFIRNCFHFTFPFMSNSFDTSANESLKLFKKIFNFNIFLMYFTNLFRKKCYLKIASFIRKCLQFFFPFISNSFHMSTKVPVKFSKKNLQF